MVIGAVSAKRFVLIVPLLLRVKVALPIVTAAEFEMDPLPDNVSEEYSIVGPEQVLAPVKVCPTVKASNVTASLPAPLS
jgi:hypothetical protein